MLSISPFSIPLFLSSTFILIASIYVFVLNPRSKTHHAFLYFGLSLVIWLGCYGIVYSCNEYETAFFWIRKSFIGVGMISFTNFYFYNAAVKLNAKRPVLLCFFTVALAFIIFSQIPPYRVYTGANRFFWGYYTKVGFAHTIFLTYWAIVWSYGLRLVYKKMQQYKDQRDFVAYNQTKYLYLGYVGECLGFADFLAKYGIPVYPFGYLSTIYWILIVSFALVRYKMLADISFLTRRVLIGSGILAAMGSVFGLSYLFIEILQKFVPLNASILLTFSSVGVGISFQPINHFVKNLIDKNFFPEYFDRKEKLARLGQEIALAKNSAEFNRIILESIFSSFKIVKSSFFIWIEHEKAFLMQSASGWGLEIGQNVMTRIEPDHPIPQYLETRDYLLLDEIRRDFSAYIDQRTLSLAMLELDGMLSIPIRSNNKLLGFFILGDKESGLPYGKEDLKTLKILAEHTAIALENIDLTKRWSEEHTHVSQMDKILHTYMSSSVADEVLRRVDQAQNWKGDRRHATILMSDLRGFTNLSERFSPEEIVRTLNEYFSEMVDVIMQNGGTVDKFMGDAILAVFGVPKPLPESEKAAVQCALEMHACLKKLNLKRNSNGLFTLEMGIGIAAGDVVAGNIGSDKRMEYTVIGDVVNTASRLQSIAASGNILVTNKILDKVANMVQYNRLPPIAVKGKSQPMDVIEILGPKNGPQISPASDPDVIDLPLFGKEAQQ